MDYAVKYIGILFSEEMVKSILLNLKTVTRRKFDIVSKSNFNARSKYGDVNDILYVKETHYLYGEWIKNGISVKTGRQKWKFNRLSNKILFFDTINNVKINKQTDRTKGWYKKSSLFLEKRFARIFLRRIDGFALEKIHDITEQECKNEGILRLNDQVFYNYITKKYSCITAKESFITLWQKINGIKSWENNVYVHRIPFAVIKNHCLTV